MSDFFISDIIFYLFTFNQVVNFSFWHLFQNFGYSFDQNLKITKNWLHIFFIWACIWTLHTFLILESCISILSLAGKAMSSQIAMCLVTISLTILYENRYQKNQHLISFLYVLNLTIYEQYFLGNCQFCSCYSTDLFTSTRGCFIFIWIECGSWYELKLS